MHCSQATKKKRRRPSSGNGYIVDGLFDELVQGILWCPLAPRLDDGIHMTHDGQISRIMILFFSLFFFFSLFLSFSLLSFLLFFFLLSHFGEFSFESRGQFLIGVIFEKHSCTILEGLLHVYTCHFRSPVSGGVLACHCDRTLGKEAKESYDESGCLLLFCRWW